MDGYNTPWGPSKIDLTGQCDDPIDQIKTPAPIRRSMQGCYLKPELVYSGSALSETAP